MPSLFPQLVDAYEDCQETCAQLLECLDEERLALVGLKMDQIIQSNLRKEGLVLALRRKHTRLKAIAKVHFHSETLLELSAHLPEDEALTWRAMYETWKVDWDRVARKCEQNQKFIRHSLKNVGLIVENLKRLFGISNRYAANGKRVDSGGEGQVVQVRY